MSRNGCVTSAILTQLVTVKLARLHIQRYAVLGLSLMTPIQGYATGARPTFPPVAAAVVSVSANPVKARHHPIKDRIGCRYARTCAG